MAKLKAVLATNSKLHRESIEMELKLFLFGSEFDMLCL